MIPRAATCWIVAAALGASGQVRAEEPAPQGQRLYDEGVAAYTAGDLQVACPKFKASFEADRRAPPLFMLAKCEERQGRAATALDHYEEVIRMGGLEAELLEQAAQSVSRLGPIVPKIKLERGGAPAGAVAKVDGALVAVGPAVRLDPGEHTLLVEAPGRAPRSTTFTLKESDDKTIELRVGDALGPPEGAGGGEARAPESASDPSLWIAGGVVGGVGVASFVVFAATGGVILDQCGGDLGCPERARTDAPSDELAIANQATFWIGAAGTGAGIALLVAAAVTDDAEAKTATLGPGPCPLGVGVTWAF
jgi:hypothetical protein